MNPHENPPFFLLNKHKMYVPMSQVYLEKELVPFITSKSKKPSKQNPNLNQDLAHILAIRFDKLFNVVLPNCEAIIRNDSSKTFSNESFDQISNFLDEFFFALNEIFNQRINETLKTRNIFSYSPKPRLLVYTHIRRMFFEPFYFLFTKSNNSIDLNDLKATITLLRHLKPLCFSSAPHSNFFYPDSICNYQFEFPYKISQEDYLKKFIPHGLSSNGQLVFVLLCPNILYVFPLINSGSLMKPSIFTLSHLTLTKQSSIVAYPTFIEIYLFPNCNTKKIVLIDDILSTSYEIDKITAQQTPQILFKITDGISCVLARTVKNDQTFEIECVTQEMRTNKVLKKVTLTAMEKDNKESINLCPEYSMNKEIPELHPNHDLFEVPIETNGTIISFIHKTSVNDSIHRSFSLLTGEMLSDEKFSFQSSKPEEFFENNDNPYSNLDFIPTFNPYPEATKGIIIDPPLIQSIQIDQTNNDNPYLKMPTEISDNPYLSLLNENESDDKVNESEIKEILSITIDCINQCRWCLVISNNKVCLRKMVYYGGINPLIFQIRGIQPKSTNNNQFAIAKFKYLGILQCFLRYSCCSLRPILHYHIDEINLIIDLLKELQKKPINEEQLIMQQIATMWVSINLETITKNDEAILFETIEKMTVIELQFMIFFSNLPFLFHLNKRLTARLLFKLIKHAISQKDELVSYALRKLENADQFAEIDCLEIIKNNDKSLLSLLIIHQRVLIRTVYNYLENINPFDTLSNGKDFTPLNYFALYVTQLFSSFEKSIKKVDESSLVYILFNNFIQLVFPLHKFHTIAHIINTSLYPILKPFSSLLNDNKYKSDALTVIYAYGTFAACLISGGFVDEFEHYFSWLNAFSQSFFEDLDNLFDENLKSFPELNQMLNDYYLLEFWHKNKDFRAQMKYQDEELRYIETLAIVALAKHTGCFEEFLQLIQTNKLSSISNKLFSCLCQMDRIGVQCLEYMKNGQLKQLDNVINKTLVLLHLPDLNNQYFVPENFADFIISPFTIDYVKNSLAFQKNKSIATMAEYERISRLLASNNNPLFNDILEYSLSSQTTTFEGLRNIFQISGLPKLLIIDVLTKLLVSPFKRIRIIVYQFFVASQNNQDLLSTFRDICLNLFNKNREDLSLYALSLSLIVLHNSLCSIPSELFPLSNDIFSLSLVEASISKLSLDSNDSNTLKEFIFNKNHMDDPYRFKIILRIQRFLIGFDTNHILSYLSYIGQFINDWNQTINQYNAIEMIYFLRSPYCIQHIYSHIIHSNLDKFTQLGLCFVLGYQMEHPRNFSSIVYEDQVYIGVCNQLNDKFSLYSIQFDTQEPLILDTNSSSVSIIPDEMINNSPFIEYLLNLLKQIHNNSIERDLFLPIVSQGISLYIETNPYASFPSDVIDIMSSMIIPVDDLYHTYDHIKTLKQKAHNTIVKDLNCHFGVIKNSFGGLTYLTKTIKNTAPAFIVEVNFHIEINQKIEQQNLIDQIQFHFGVASDTVESDQTLVSLISYPDGKLFPDSSIVYSFEDTKISYKLKHTDVSISFIVNPESHSFNAQNHTIPFPPGHLFRLCIITQEIQDTSMNTSISLFTPSEEEINIDDVVFVENSYPTTKKIIDLFKEQTFSSLKDKEIQLESTEKLKTIHFDTPVGFPIHIDESYQSSPLIQVHQLNGLYVKFGQQWITIALTQLARFNPSLISKYAFELYSVLSIPLENYLEDEFIKGNFPYSLSQPSWQNPLFDKKKFILAIPDILLSICQDKDCLDNIIQGLVEKSSIKHLHYIALPHKSHKYIHNPSQPICFGFCPVLVSWNDCKEVQRTVDLITYLDNPIQIHLPAILHKDDQTYWIQVNHEDIMNDISLLFPAGADANYSIRNGWIIDTSIEILVHLKNLMFTPLNNYHIQKLKSIVIDMFLFQSPFVLMYLDEFVEFLLKFPNKNGKIEEEYKKRLVALGFYLKSNPNPNFMKFYENEMQFLASSDRGA